MNNKVIDSIGRIDDDMIQEVEKLRTRKKIVRLLWTRRWVVAACLGVALISIVFVQTRHIGVQDKLLKAVEFSGVQTVGEASVRIPVENREAIYTGVYFRETNWDKENPLESFVGKEHVKTQNRTWYRVKNMKELKYLISEDENGYLSLWEFSAFKSPYTYGDVYRIIFDVQSADDIASITTSPSISQNTDEGKKVQKEIGTHTYTKRSDIETFYNCTVKVACGGGMGGSNIFKDIYTYSFTGDAYESTREERVLRVTLKSGTTIDNWRYNASKGQFYEYGGIFGAPIEEEQVYALNEIFGIK